MLKVGQLRDASFEVSTKTKKRSFCMYFSVVSLLYHITEAQIFRWFRKSSFCFFKQGNCGSSRLSTEIV